jgi:glycosyltransferase involved in cell wall biosynthesis
MIACGWFLSDLSGGGAERIPLVIAPAMRTSHLNVVLLKDHIQHAVPAGGPPIIALSSRGTSLARHGVPILARAVKVAKQFDVIVAGLEWAPTFFAAACGALSGRPVIATVHTDLRRYHELEPVPAGWWTAMKYALRHCAAIVAVSQGVRDSLRGFGLDARRIHVVPPPGPPEQIARTSKRGCSRILTVAGLKPIKGVDVALEAAAKLSDLDFEWNIVGDGPELARLRRQAADLQLLDRVKFVGFRSNPQSFYAAADLYVLPSRSEGAGIVLLEALSAGLPIVATRCGSLAEHIVDDSVGQLVRNSDGDALAGAIRSLLSDPERRRRLGEAARDRAREYEPTIIAERYDRLLAAVAESAPRTASTTRRS